MHTNTSMPSGFQTLPDVARWSVARTGARWEKSVKEFFDTCHTFSYLPLINHRRVYGKRIRNSLIPLFSGYVFFDADGIEPHQIYSCAKIAQVLHPDDPQELRNDLANIARALQAAPDLRPCLNPPPGSPVMVKHGPLEGIRGVLVRHETSNMLIVRVKFIGCSAELKIDEALCEWI